MIFYVGNALSKHGLTQTSVETLAKLLARKYKVMIKSDKLNLISRFWDMLYFMFKNRKKINLVFIDTYSYRAFWYAYFIARLAVRYKIKYVPIIHGGDFENRLKKSQKKTIYLLKNSFKIVSPSLFMQHILEQFDIKSVYIPNNIEIKKYKFKKRQNLKLKFLWVRSFHKIYNPNLSIQIIEHYVKKGFSPELCMVGPDKDGSMEEFKTILDKQKLGQYVKITGRLSKEQWRTLSQEYDIFLNTTNFDNQPVSVIEAMALGLPVVSTNVGGVPFLIDNGVDGLLVEPNNAEEFIEKIDTLIGNNELISNITTNARKKVERFDWDIVKQSWFDIIETAKNNNNERKEIHRTK